MRRLFYITTVFLLIAAGCSNKHKTPSDQAKLQWNHARAAVLVSLAADQYANANYDKCKQTVAQAMRMDPSNVRLHLIKAKVAIEESELESAQQSLDLARQLDPKNAEADYLSGIIYQRWQRPDVSLTYYTQATEKAPAELSYLMARAEMLVAVGKPDEGLRLLQEKVQYFEHSGAIRDAVGQLLARAGKFDEAVEQLRQASILAPADQTIREHLALTLLQAGHYREAAGVLGRLVKDEAYAKRPDLFAAIGECRMKTGQFRDARASFETACQLDGSNPAAWLGFAKAALQCGDLPRTELATKKALVLDPRNSESHLMVGYLRLKQGRHPEALAAFKKSYELDPTDTTALCMTGVVLERTGEHEAAMNCYARALQIKPGDDLASQLMTAIEVE